MKKYILACSVFLLLAAGCSKSVPVIVSPTPTPPVPTIQDSKNLSYTIEGKTVTLINGQAEVATSGDSVENFNYFGNEATGDFNNDGTQDTAFLLTETSDGTGTFYYLVAALKTAQSMQGTNGILIGDRIAPQTTEFRNGEIIVNYADRKPGEPMTASPAVGVSKYFKVLGNTLVEIPNPNLK